MFRSLRITGFRDIERLNVERLARVNLFVGGNNSGKTSLLEAVEILLGRGDVHSLVAGSLRRDETMDVHQDGRQEVAVRHLFRGHELRPEARFTIEGDNGIPRVVQVEAALLEAEEASPPGLWVSLQADGQEKLSQLALSPEGSLTYMPPFRMRGPRSKESRGGFNFITTAGAGLGQLLQLWDEVVLSPDEALVLDALRIIEPQIARIAAVDREVSSGAFMLLMQNNRSRTPLGSMGDGVRRLLALAIHLVRSAGGTLLIDEIDTGLHHSVMVQMWKLVVETAARLDVQVFATTHSMDCVAALATLSEDEPALKPAVLLHRVEKHREATVIYSADELAEAASAGIEMRGVRG
jgi:predicted ATPase